VRTDRRTDVKKLIAAFRNFAYAPKNRNKQEYWFNPELTPCSLAEYTDASEDPAAVIITVEDGDSRYLWNVCIFLPDYTASLLIRRQSEPVTLVVMKILFSGTKRCPFGKKCKDVSENLTSSIFRVGERTIFHQSSYTVVGESENSHKQRNTGSTEVIFQDVNCRQSVGSVWETEWR